MGLSRKRQRELGRLKGAASELWDEQKEVLDRAIRVVREARRQLAKVGREEVVPRVRDAIDSRVIPGVASGIAATRHAARSARQRVADDVLPAVTSALGSAITMLELARDPRVREAVGRVRQRGSKAATVAARGSSGAGRRILIGVGLVAAAGIAYAAWQTLRAEDELWVGEESDELDEQ